MLRRLSPAVALLLIAGVGLAGCADDVSPAARIGDVTITHDELMDEAAEWAGNDATQASQQLAVEGVPAAYSSAPVAIILSERIILDLLGAEFDRRDLEITPEAEAQAFALIGIDPSQEEALLGGFSDGYRADYLERWAKAGALQLEIGDELQELLRQRASEVEVNPRYGTWDPTTFNVTPPAGPRSAER